MEFKKNDVLIIDIEDMGYDGEGIGKADGYTLFVKDTVIGDRAEVKIMKTKKNYGYARLLKVLRPSPDRTEPRCPIARACGGCQLQFLSYEKQLEFKKKKVLGNLQRIGGFVDIQAERVLGMEDPWRYRNKAQFPVGRNKEGEIVTGFYAGRTHSIVPNRDCLLGVEVNEKILNRILTYMETCHAEPYDEKTGTGLVRHILLRYGFKTGEIMVCLIINGTRIPAQDSLVEALKDIPGMTSISLNDAALDCNVILGEKVIPLWGKEYITDYIGIDPVSDFSPVLLSGKSGTDRETLRNRSGICGTYRGKRLSGISTAGSAPFPCSWPRRQNRSTGWKSFLLPSEMPGETPS